MIPLPLNSPEAIALCFCCLLVAACAIALCFAPGEQPKRNRRIAMGAPIPDDRSSIERFRNMHRAE